MTEMVLDINELQSTIFSKITTKKVKVSEDNGTITLKPISEEKTNYSHLIGMFSDGKISVDDFIKEKQKEKELEL